MLERTEHVTVEACGYGNEAAGMVDRHRTGFDGLCHAICGGLAPAEGQKRAAGCVEGYIDAHPEPGTVAFRGVEQRRDGLVWRRGGKNTRHLAPRAAGGTDRRPAG